MAGPEMRQTKTAGCGGKIRVRSIGNAFESLGFDMGGRPLDAATIVYEEACKHRSSILGYRNHRQGQAVW